MRVPEIKKTPRALDVALRIRCLGAVLAVFFLPVLLAADAPSWWASGGVLKAGKAADDYAAVNQGQVKNIARAAMNHLDAYCPGGAGGTIHQLLESWNTPTARTDDFSAVNLGQLKALAAPFYDRLIQVGYSNDYPWSNAFWPPDDYAVANIGQVKNLFGFDLRSVDALHDKDPTPNTLADWWEIYYFGATGVNPDGMDFGNGQTNAQNQAQGNSAPGVGDGTKVPPGAGTHTGAGSGGSSGGTTGGTGGTGGPGSSNDQNGRVLLVLSGICKQLQVGPETIQTGNTDAMTVVKTISLLKGKSYPITVTDLTGRKEITVYIQVPVGVGFITVPYTYTIDTGKDGSQVNDIGYEAVVIPAATSGFVVSDTNSVLLDASNSQNHIIPADGTYAGPMMGYSAFIPSAELKKANSASLQPLLGQLKVDANGDGTIDGKDQVTKDKPYQFWLNDDTDEGGVYSEHGGIDDVPPSAPDYNSAWIRNRRNLEDLTRLWVHIGDFRDAIISGSIQVGLKWKTVSAGAPAIKIFLSADPHGSLSYLTNITSANSQISDPYNYQIWGKNRKEKIDAGIYILPKDHISGSETTPIDWNKGAEHFLFEGASEGKGELELVFLDKSGTQIGEGGSLWLDLKNIKKMYVRARGTPLNGVASPWTSVDPTPTNFVDDSSANAFEKPADEEKNVIVFIHGIHPPATSESAGYMGNINVAETIFKRLWHAGFKGRFACYTWPAMTPAGIPPFGFDFNESEYRAWKYGKGLSKFVASLPSDYGKHILAHSQGNAVVGAAFRSYGLSAATWIPTNGAIPISCYDSDMSNYVFNYTTPDLASNLGYRGYLESHVNARVVNFCNPEDSITGVVWETNQEMFKPARAIITPFGGTMKYRYDSTAGKSFVEKGFLYKMESQRQITDNHESMAMVVQSRSRAVGQGWHVGGIVDSNVDINNEYSFGDSHGAQWDFGIQEALLYYEKIINIIHNDE